VKTPKILLVDDDPNVTAILATSLRRADMYELREENCARDAAAAAREFRPDVAILDVDMPDKDGGEVAIEFKNDPLLKDVTLIVMSGLISPQDKGVRSGAVYLPMPFPLGALNQVIEIVLAGRAAAKGNRKSGELATSPK
jgi:two-component system OmpR family response regulator